MLSVASLFDHDKKGFVGPCGKGGGSLIEGDRGGGGGSLIEGYCPCRVGRVVTCSWCRLH